MADKEAAERYSLAQAQELMNCAREGRVPLCDQAGQVVPRGVGSRDSYRLPLRPMEARNWLRIQQELARLAEQ